MQPRAPERDARKLGERGEVAAHAEQDRVRSRQAKQGLQFHAQMEFVGNVLARHRGAVRTPDGVILGAGVQTRVDRHRPVQSADRMAIPQPQQILQRAIKHTKLMPERNRSMPFMEGHAQIKLEGPIRLRGDHPAIDEKIVLALILQREITLRLSRDIFERRHG